MVGGGTVFGPQPRSFRQRMPRKMRRLALRSALSIKAEEGKVSVFEGLGIEEPRTRVMVDLLRSIGIEDTVLLVLPASNEVVARCVGNLPWAKVILASNLNLYDLFTHDHLLIARDALDLIEETFGNGGASRVPAEQEAGPDPVAAGEGAEVEAAEEL
jgi:large subunit ribosomal protein L4